MTDNTPVIIGVGEASERIDAPDYEALSPADLAGRAAAAAVADARATGDLADAIDVIAAIRQFEVSHPRAVAPFGKADNFPRAVAARIGADPTRAILEPVGGQGPQHLVNEFANIIGRGETDMVLICGSEAISTVRHLASKGETRDWSEAIGGQLEDRGYGEDLVSADLPRHGARTPINLYAIFENARRARLGLSRKAYALEMGRLFAPFTKVAAQNPHAMSREIYSAEELVTVTGPNRMTSDPFRRRLVARDQANQGAAVVIASIDRARDLGVPADRFVYLLGGADVRERSPMERADLSASPAAALAAKQALAAARASVAEIDLFDFYSCFPIAVFNVRDGLGIADDDPRPLTVTGGLPYFGGAGNNYSMHAIASMARALRERPEAKGLVVANGGYLSKCSVGVYSAAPSPWRAFDSKALQADVDGWPAPPVGSGEGRGIIDTFTVDHAGAVPVGITIGTLSENGARFVSMTEPLDPTIAEAMIAHDPLGGTVTMAPNAEGRSIIRSFDPIRPPPPQLFDQEERGEASHRLFYAIRPDAGAIEDIGHLQRDPGGRGLLRHPVEASRLHVTLIHLGDFHGEPPVSLMSDAMTAAASIRLEPFEVTFERLVGTQRSLLMRPSAKLVALEMFHQRLLFELIKLGAHLKSGAPLRRQTFRPHITLSYHPNRIPEQLIDPVSWTVRDFVLIESLIDKHKHIERGRWLLAA